MALKLNSKNEILKIIPSMDDCVDCSEVEYKKYLETLDEKYLNLKEGLPIKFCIKTNLNYGEQETVLNKLTKGDSVKFSFGYIMEDVRCSLVDIENNTCEELKFKKDDDGFASKDLIALLNANNIVLELFTAKQSAINKNKSVKKK